MAAQTLYDKLWESHVVRTDPDGTSLLYIDRHLVHEVTSPQAFEGLKLAGRKPWRVHSIVATADHNTPTDNWDLGIAGIKDPVSRLQVETLDAEGIHQQQRIPSHVPQRIGRLHRQTKAIAQHGKAQAGLRCWPRPGGQADIAVIETDDPETLPTQALDHVVRPVDQLPTQSHDQQQGRIAVATDTLVGQAHFTDIDLTGRHGGVATVGRKGRQAAHERGEDK